MGSKIFIDAVSILQTKETGNLCATCKVCMLLWSLHVKLYELPPFIPKAYDELEIPQNVSLFENRYCRYSNFR